MIITTIKIHGRSKKRREIVQTLRGLTEQMIKSGDCLRADLYQDIDDNNTLYFMEEWRTRKDLDKYKASRSMAVLLGMETLLAESVEIRHAVRLDLAPSNGGGYSRTGANPVAALSPLPVIK